MAVQETLKILNGETLEEAVNFSYQGMDIDEVEQ